MKMFQVRLNTAWKHTHTHTHTVFFSPGSILEIAGLIYIFEKTINLNGDLMGK